MFDFGLRLRQQREKYNMSQEALGQRIGRSKSVISSYENNLKIPPLDILTKMAALFNVSLDYLVGLDKAEMVSISGLSETQKVLVQQLVTELKAEGSYREGLSERQQVLLSHVMREFAKKNK